jgi:prophage regulatory protein
MHTTPGSLLALERLPAALERCGISRSEAYRRIAAKTFPAPIRIGARAVAFNRAEIDQWIRDRIAERDARAAA